MCMWGFFKQVRSLRKASYTAQYKAWKIRVHSEKQVHLPPGSLPGRQQCVFQDFLRWTFLALNGNTGLSASHLQLLHLKRHWLLPGSGAPRVYEHSLVPAKRIPGVLWQVSSPTASFHGKDDIRQARQRGGGRFRRKADTFRAEKKRRFRETQQLSSMM